MVTAKKGKSDKNPQKNVETQSKFEKKIAKLRKIKLKTFQKRKKSIKIQKAI